MKRLSWIMVILCVLFCPVLVFAGGPDDETEDIHAFVIKLFNERAQLLMDQKPEAITKFYDAQSGRYAYEQELLRSRYINAWAEKRNIAFTAADSSIRIVRIKKENGLAKVSVAQSLKLSYVYKTDNYNPQHFGIGTRHGITLKNIDGKWLVQREWYSDPLTENPKWIPEFDGFPKTTFYKIEPDTGKSYAITKYNRERAVQYANKYAGLAWGAGNNNRYNRKYLDYSHLGGDCTNFASQVLGDMNEGGGLRMGSGWHYRSEGSQAWVRTDSFKDFVLQSGYGHLVVKGFFTDVVRPTDKYPNGAVGALKPGDLIAYEMDGDVDHFSVLVGFDDHGYPLVNSHSADRYRVPFDLGWDKHTKYLLIHIND
ncbi:hypothetical protein E1757_34850 [Paenibacillus piri]|uniref:Putative amidase domain-containing protein n=1 Tax=Paenibacillus piri TaxID=2547395 RepID=A0A4R5K6T6_9BACL|nr:hypothetical protein E1757_34850 [Paenibacillus piri]